MHVSKYAIMVTAKTLAIDKCLFSLLLMPRIQKQVIYHLIQAPHKQPKWRVMNVRHFKGHTC